MAEPAPLQPSNRRVARRFPTACLLCAIAVLALISVGPRLPAQNRPSQYDVEAAYLLDFGKFTQLSTGSHTPQRATFDVCIVGRDPIGPTIDKLAANDTVDNREVQVLRDASASQARTCAIAYFNSHDDDLTRDALKLLAGADVLTVGDSPNFLKDGGMVQFVVETNHVRFAVNLDAVRKTHIVLSSQLLRVALYVEGQPKPEAGR